MFVQYTYAVMCIYSSVMLMQLDGHLQPSMKKRKYGVDPTAHQQRLEHIKEVRVNVSCCMAAGV